MSAKQYVLRVYPDAEAQMDVDGFWWVRRKGEARTLNDPRSPTWSASAAWKKAAEKLQEREIKPDRRDQLLQRVLRECYDDSGTAMSNSLVLDLLMDVDAQARAEMKERCARICEESHLKFENAALSEGAAIGLQHGADRIRALSDKQEDRR